MVESTGLENRHTLIAYLGFKSLSLRHYSEASLEIARLSSFLTLGNSLGTGINPLADRIPGLGIPALCHLRRKSMLDADLRGWLPVLGIMLGEEDIQEIYNDASDALVEYISPNGNVNFNITAHVVTYQAGHVTS